jgi:hypothetical protein
MCAPLHSQAVSPFPHCFASLFPLPGELWPARLRQGLPFVALRLRDAHSISARTFAGRNLVNDEGFPLLVLVFSLILPFSALRQLPRHGRPPRNLSCEPPSELEVRLGILRSSWSPSVFGSLSSLTHRTDHGRKDKATIARYALSPLCSVNLIRRGTRAGGLPEGCERRRLVRHATTTGGS